jgi:predicted branched-subunit amino acid permease
MAYGVAARGAGLGLVETQIMSLTVFSAAAQMSAVVLMAAGAPGIVVVGAALADTPVVGRTPDRRVFPD